MTVRVRFAPSPTGRFHIGGARTALYNKLVSDKYGGKFYIRIEDTDRSRYSKEAATELIEALGWLGLNWDEGPTESELLELDVEPDMAKKYGKVVEQSYIQSKRKEIYAQYANQLLEAGKAYPVFTEEVLDTDGQSMRFSKLSELADLHKWRTANRFMVKKMLATGQPYYLMLKLPREDGITVYDELRGSIDIPWKKRHDSVIVKPDGMPTYHLASVVDDMLMNTTHVIRGEEWLSSLPLHFFLYESLGWDRPKFVHLPVILNPTGKGKMSKRAGVKDGTGKDVPVFVAEYKNRGFVPEALVNFMALTGWNPKSEQEFMTWDELVDKFDFSGINKTGAAWNYKKLLFFNRQYIKNMSADKFAKIVEEYL